MPLAQHKPRWQQQVLIFSLLFLLALIAISVLPDYTTSHNSLSAPSWRHWLGTNDIGQDILLGLLIAFPNTVLISILVALSSLSFGLALAALAAFKGAIINTVILRAVDMLQAIPSILLMLLFAAWFQPNFWGVIILLSLMMWHDDIRVLRTLLLREMNRENIQYAKHMGASDSYCIKVHILPAITPTLLGLFIQQTRQATMKAAGLGFLGLSAPTLITWGSLMRDALDYIHSPAVLWLLLPPAICLSAFLFFLLNVGQNFEKMSLGSD